MSNPVAFCGFALSD